MAFTHYPTNLPCPLLAGNNMQGGRTFLRSTFEYATRQRQTYCNDYLVGFNFVLKDEVTMKAWKDFYYTTLRNGSMPFIANWEIEGISGDKEFRFSSIYNTKSLGAGIFQVTASFEMITKIKDL